MRPAINNARPIGVFDSGLGGLTVMRALRTLLPNEEFIYVGDTARAPYGGRSTESLRAYCREIVGFLLRHNVKAVVMACGTTASTAYEALGSAFPGLPIIDVLRPSAKAVAALALRRPGLRVGFIATAATVRRGMFPQLVRSQNPAINIEARACPLFAPMTECGLFTGAIPHWAAAHYLSDWRDKIDALVLGCTHYPLLAATLAEILPRAAQIDLGQSTAQAVANMLDETNQHRTEAAPPKHRYYISGSEAKFNPSATLIMGEKINATQIFF